MSEIVMGEALVVMDKMIDQPSGQAQGDTAPATAIRATLAPKITFASHQNDVPTILDLVVENNFCHV